MGFTESAFQRLVKALNRARSTHDPEPFSDYVRRLELFAALCLEPSFTPKILLSRKFVGLDQTSLFLPEVSKFIPDSSLTLRIYLQLILQISAAQNLNFFSKRRLPEIAGRIEFIKKMSVINHYLDQHFPNYRLLQTQVLDGIRANVPHAPKYQSIHSFWISQFLSRQQHPKIKPPQENFKINEAVPTFLLITTPCLEVRAPTTEQKISSSKVQKREPNQDSKTERDRTYSNPAENIDFEKEESNPAYHSFEKTETAEEYQGGRRMDSGDDELADHATALEELDLSHVTTGGEAAQSVYRAEGGVLTTSAACESPIESKTAFIYPEWNVRQRKYLKEHCQLFELPMLAKGQSHNFRTLLELDYVKQISQARDRISHLVNEPAWKNQLKDGDEIDFDSFARDYVNLLHKKQVSGRWYAQKSKLLRDASIFILFDQSLSSDSWAKNRRILDVFIEAIGIAGILFEDLLPLTHVAGTWSATRHQCVIQTYKLQQEDWNAFFSRIQYVEPQGYTRLGPAIRHAAQLLSKEHSRHKLLLLLTDGRPTDLDGYEGAHGIGDIRQACLEAERIGVVPFALTVDHIGKHTFPKMFRRYKILTSPEHLPIELFRILGQLLGKSK